MVYNASTNRQTTDCADANGNLSGGTPNPYPPYGCSGILYTYDVSNRVVSVAAGTQYAYAPGNQRVWRFVYDINTNSLTLDEVTLWSVTGKRLATFNLVETAVPGHTILYPNLAVTNTYFGRRLISNGTGNIVVDRLGSIGKFYPWGDEKPSATTTAPRNLPATLEIVRQDSITPTIATISQAWVGS